MPIGGSPPGAPRAKEGSKGAAGRYTFLVEVARGYLGALWLARDGADSSEESNVFSRHVTPLVAASARAAILDGARWTVAGADDTEFQVFESRSAVDLVTPFVDGEILRGLLRTAAVKHVTAEPSVLLGIARELVEQLGALHDRAAAPKSPHAFGGVHPDSILVDLRGRVHLLDVGAGAAASAREPWRSDPQRIGYFAPEQTEARGVVDARTDVFCIGIVLWEALANRRLFPGNDAKTARERVQKAQIQRLDATRSSASPGIATDIASVVARCLERDPAARYQSTNELAEALDALDIAPADRVGTWVTSLADAAIAKRRQFLTRAAAGQLTGEERISLPPPSVGRRPSDSPARTSAYPSLRPSGISARPSQPSSPPRDRPSSVPASPARPSGNPVAARVLQAGASATATPVSAGAPGASVAPRTGGTLPGPTPDAAAPPASSAVHADSAVHAVSVARAGSAAPPNPPRASGTLPGPAPFVDAPRPRMPPPTPPPPSIRHAMSGAPLPPSARQSATSTPIAGPPPPPSARASTPPSNGASATPPPPEARPSATSTPVAGTPRLPDSTASATPAPVLEGSSEPTPVVPQAGVSPEGSPAPSPDSVETAQAPSAPVAAGEASPESAGAVEATEPGDATLDEDVEDDDETEEPMTPSKRPPPLPHDEQHLPLAALAGLSSARIDEPLARPIHQSDLSKLTARQLPVGLPRSAVVAALVSLLALGGFVLIRWRAHARDAGGPRIERTVETPPVRIEEPVSAAHPSALPPAPAVSVAPPEPAASGAPPAAASAAPAETAEQKPSEEKASPTGAAAPKPEAAEKPRTTHATVATETPHRPAPSHDTSTTGFKPGGI